jgi:hypothetical protein
VVAPVQPDELPGGLAPHRQVGESLNAGIAASIALYEIAGARTRQR